MALQGDLQSFALPDVLRLLAGTGKTGRLGVTAETGSGDVWLRDGQVVAASVTSSPHAGEAADVVFELLRFNGGSFRFEDGEEPAAAGEPSSVDDAISRAEELVREWEEVEAVVPSVHAWVTLAPELGADDITLSADQWRTLAALGGGLSVRGLGDRFELTDLAASREVKGLVEAGLVELGEAPEPVEAPAAAPVAEAPAPAPDAELSVLQAEDGPVVIETSEDALLPEPLPGAGTSFEGDLSDLGSVDGRDFEAMEAEALAEAGLTGEVDHAEPEIVGATDSFAADVFFGAAAEDGSEAGGPAEVSATTEEVAADPLALTADDATGGADAASEPTAEAPSSDGDRDSLMQFLSSVKN